mmetsp:Transcript_15358/g.18630  ORF Transcript_15358/g.18630 Transcript_15358/m.18630 type:complete len:405 (+) Transcript_15358:82-1296(+)
MGNGSSNSSEHLKQSEANLLNWGLNWYKNTEVLDKNRSRLSWKAYDVPISIPNVVKKTSDQTRGHIHTVEFMNEDVDTTDKTPIVLMHGYGAGTGHYYSMLPGIADSWKGKVFSIDSFGSGLSSRPKWTLGVGDKVPAETAESYFVDAIEAWRETQKIEKMVLFGHSLGGYLSVAYAEKYPQRVEQLILCSPVGIPEKPELDPKNLPMFYRFARTLWNNGFTPYHAVKATGRRFVGKYVDRRFEDSSWTNKELLKEYMYRNWTTGNISAGGYAHATLLEPGAYARKPLHSRLHDVATSVGQISFIYGTEDWMNVNHAINVRTTFFSKANSVSQSSRLPIRIFQIEGGGHNMFIDNPLGVVDAIQECVTVDQSRTNVDHNQVPRLGEIYLRKDFQAKSFTTEVAA